MMEKKNAATPPKPGVYLFKSKNGEVLYVGKAKNLRSRIASYFGKMDMSRPWTSTMLPLIREIETIVTSNETEALMLEATLIKKHMPRFNILLTDDKSYPYIRLTVEEEFPRLQVVRRIGRDKAKYFGPYLSARSATVTCELLRKLYGVHLARQPIKANPDKRACLNCQLEGNRCPYAGAITREEYNDAVHKAVNYLQGGRKALVRDIERKMKQAAKERRFELAAKLRDKLKLLRQLSDKQVVVSATAENYDAIALARNTNLAVISLLSVREGSVVGQRSFNFTAPPEESDGGLLRQFLTAYFANFSELPPLLVVNKAVEDSAEVEKLLTRLRGGRMEIRLSRRGKKLTVVELASKNAQEKLDSRLKMRDSSAESLIALRELLYLEKLPERIEAIDISNLGSSETVGATVCFVGGRPDKNEYRRYKITTVKGPNDLAMIAEVVRRRLADTTRPLPDLLLIDGGSLQLSAALASAKRTRNSKLETQNSPAIIALAKKPDRVFVPGRKLPLPVTRGHKGVMLLSRIRDEAHRFAVTFHQRRQRRRSLNQSGAG